VVRVRDYSWVVFTSRNGADAFFDRLTELGRDARAFGDAKIAAIGPKTAAALSARGIRVDLVPTAFVNEAVAAELLERTQPGERVLEIGTGWGGFALHAASRYGCHVTTTTISREQHAMARERIDDHRLFIRRHDALRCWQSFTFPDDMRRVVIEHLHRLGLCDQDAAVRRENDCQQQRGHRRARHINGHDAIKLVLGGKFAAKRNAFRYWVDAVTFQPAEMQFPPFSAATTITVNWIPKTPALVKQTNTPDVPAGYRRVPPPRGFH